MSDQYGNEPMLEMFLFESTQLIEQLEQLILTMDEDNSYTQEVINEIFRIMHTIKGSSAMMMFNVISELSHAIEDLFYYMREENPQKLDLSILTDLVFEGVDFIKIELEKIRNNDPVDGVATEIIDNLKNFLDNLKEENCTGTLSKESKQDQTDKQKYYVMQNKKVSAVYKNSFKAVIYFEDGCEMENIRAYTIVHNLKDITEEFYYLPDDIIDNDKSIDVIRNEGFQIFLKTDLTYENIHDFFMQTIFLRDLELKEILSEEEYNEFAQINREELQEYPVKIPELSEKQSIDSKQTDRGMAPSSVAQSIISVSVSKLDKLMDLVGEMVIAEAMVIQNPDLQELELDNFNKAARQLNKITSEIQDMVMSVRMVPLSATFQKMHRVVRDMRKKLKKDVNLAIIGEDTEVDKNIIEHISDPLMHLVRNAMDHGIEESEERRRNGKTQEGTITLEAKNSGSDVLIIVRDDGKGLSREVILKKARENNLIYKNEEDMSDKEVYNLILLPGFSTKESITEFSGRGVGMDVVAKNIETIGGTLSVDSTIGKGTTITMKLPLTLAIIDGMNIKVGKASYTIPTISIKESFRPKEADIIIDPEGNEMIMVRGQCYQILRLHKFYKVSTDIVRLTDGILIMLEQEEKTLCVFADELLGQQQVVVKALPEYIRRFKEIKGLAGCTLLGDGRISLILDIAGVLGAI